MKRFSLACAMALTALPLSGCISFGEDPPPSLLTLDATAAPQPGQVQSSANARTITIQVPATPQALATQRIPVQSSPTAIAYVDKAQWAEPPARLFARLLADTATARGLVVLSTAQSIADPGATLSGELRTFGIDAATREAVVTYDASYSPADSETVEKRRFEARVPVSAIDAVTVGPALSQAANQVAGEVAGWVTR